MIMTSQTLLLLLSFTFLTSSYCQNIDSKTYYEAFNDLIDFDKFSSKIQQDLVINNITIDNMTLLTMFDASTKIPSGLIGGQLFDLGNFDECYNIETENNIYGKYCLGTLPLKIETQKYFELLKVNTTKRREIPQLDPQPEPRLLGVSASMGLHIAVCIPSFVKASEISGILEFSEELCQSKDTAPSLSTGAIVTIVILSVFLAIIVVSTIFDIFLYYTNKTSPHELLLAFSFLSNGRKIFSSTTNPDQLLCLNGIKAISMMWVVIGHEYSLLTMAPVSNIFYMLDWMKNPTNMFIEGATVSVDSFFVVGGLVTVYTFLRSMDKGVKFNVILYYIHRYLRLTPALGIVALIHIYLLNYFGDGPLWKTVDGSLVKPCEKAWWSTLLYITNYVREGNCIPQTWYLSVDMQLFVLSPLVLLPLFQWPIIGIAILGFLMIAGIIVPFGVAFGLDLGTMTNDENYMMEYYTQTYTRFGAYVIGMTLGYVIYLVKKSGWKLKLPSIQVAMIVGIAWLISLTGLVACVYAGHDVFVGNETDRWARSLYTAVNRPAWSLALSGMIFLCVTGYGGPVNTFLSLPIFQFLTKLSYAIYLVHYQVITVRYSTMRQNFKFTDLVIMHNFWGDFMFTLGISLLLCLSFESPIIIIEKHLFGKGAAKQKRVEKKPEV